MEEQPRQHHDPDFLWELEVYKSINKCLTNSILNSKLRSENHVSFGEVLQALHWALFQNNFVLDFEFLLDGVPYVFL